MNEAVLKHKKAWNVATDKYGKNSKQIKSMEATLQQLRDEAETSEEAPTIDTTEYENDIQEAEVAVQDLKKKEAAVLREIDALQPTMGDLRRQLEEVDARNIKIGDEMDTVHLKLEDISNMAGKKKTREVASFGPVLGGIQSDTERRTRLSSSVDGNDGAQQMNGDEIESLHTPPPPRKSARIGMAKSNGVPSYFDVLSNELVVNIFDMLTGGDRGWYTMSSFNRRWGCWDEIWYKEKLSAERYLSVISLSSTCTRMRAIESEMRHPLVRVVMPLNEDDESMSSFKSYLLREERRFDRINVICSEFASLDVLCDLRNATKDLHTAPDRVYGTIETKVKIHFPTIRVDATSWVESNLLKYIHDELTTNGPQMVRLMNELKTELESQQEGDAMAHADREMCSLGYKCDFDQSTNTGKVVAGGFFGDGFICGEQNQREITINFIVHPNNVEKPNCLIQLVSTRIYSNLVADMTRDISWDENQSTWLGIAVRLFESAISWEDAEWDTDDASSVGDYYGSDDDSEMGFA